MKALRSSGPIYGRCSCEMAPNALLADVDNGVDLDRFKISKPNLKKSKSFQILNYRPRILSIIKEESEISEE